MPRRVFFPFWKNQTHYLAVLRGHWLMWLSAKGRPLVHASRTRYSRVLRISAFQLQVRMISPPKLLLLMLLLLRSMQPGSQIRANKS